MRIYIIGNDGITLCREAPATVNEGIELMQRGMQAVRCVRGGPVRT